MTVEDIGDIVFGGLRTWSVLKHMINDVVQAGIELRRHEGLPLAVPVPPEIGFFLVSFAVERLQDQRIYDGDQDIGKVRRRLQKIERRHGVEEHIVPWRVDEAPANWQAANREWERITDAIFVDTLRPVAADMAEFFANDLDEFDRRREVGRQNFARLLGRHDVLMAPEEMIAEILEKDARTDE